MKSGALIRNVLVSIDKALRSDENRTMQFDLDIGVQDVAVSCAVVLSSVQAIQERFVEADQEMAGRLGELFRRAVFVFVFGVGRAAGHLIGVRSTHSTPLQVSAFMTAGLDPVFTVSCGRHVFAIVFVQSR